MSASGGTLPRRDPGQEAMEMEAIQESRKIKDQQKFMEDIKRYQKGVVKLNVGGRMYITSAYTLSRDQESMLATLVSGRYSVDRQPDGSIFIDRDGTHFRYILNYLRGDRGVDSLPDNWTEQHQLLKEAKYYKLEGLVKVIALKMGK